MNFMIPRTLKSVLVSGASLWSKRCSRSTSLLQFSRLLRGAVTTANSPGCSFGRLKAAYIRLRDTKVVAAKLYGPEKGLVMLDFDADENVVGIEVVGQQEFSIRELIKQVPVKTSDAVLNRTRYVAADLQPA